MLRLYQFDFGVVTSICLLVIGWFFICDSLVILLLAIHLYGANGKKAVLLSQQKLGVPERGSR